MKEGKGCPLEEPMGKWIGQKYATDSEYLSTQALESSLHDVLALGCLFYLTFGYSCVLISEFIILKINSDSKKILTN